MKKALAMALGAVLVAGSAVPAAAATQVDFSGLYRANFFANGNLGFTGDENLDENFFLDRLRLNVNFQATDAVSVHWRFQAPGGKRWGTGTHSDSLQSRFYYGQVVQDWGTVRVGRTAGPVGDEFGLSTLGWAPSVTGEFTYIAPFEGSSEIDIIQYSNSWDNGFKIKTSFARLGSKWTGAAVDEFSSDVDKDRFQIEGAYEWDGGGAALNVMYERDATSDVNTLAPIENTYKVIEDPNSPGDYINVIDKAGHDREPSERIDKTSTWYINPAIMHSWGAFSFHAEAQFGFGQTNYFNGNLRPGVDGYLEDTDASGQGFYLDFDYNYGPGRVNLAGWWVSGNDLRDDNDKNPDNKAVIDIAGGNFYPLIVAYGHDYYGAPASSDKRQDAGLGAVTIANNGKWFTQRLGILNQSAQLATDLGITELALSAATGESLLDALTQVNGVALPLGTTVEFDRGTAFKNNDANHWALMLSGQHAFTDEIRFNYAVGYLALNNPNFRVMDSLRYNANDMKSISYHNQDKDLGWEIDLGVNIQLLDNLAFSSTFGYMFTGDAYQSIKGYNVTKDTGTGDVNVNAVFEDADDAYMWMNALVFSF